MFNSSLFPADCGSGGPLLALFRQKHRRRQTTCMMCHSDMEHLYPRDQEGKTMIHCQLSKSRSSSQKSIPTFTNRTEINTVKYYRCQIIYFKKKSLLNCWFSLRISLSLAWIKTYFRVDDQMV